MAVVSRTIVTAVLRTKDETGKVTVTPMGDIGEKGAEVVKKAYGEKAELGYLPLTYEMEDKDFVKEAKLTTDIVKTPMFPTRESCPKSAAELKKFMKNN